MLESQCRTETRSHPSHSRKSSGRKSWATQTSALGGNKKPKKRESRETSMPAGPARAVPESKTAPPARQEPSTVLRQFHSESRIGGLVETRFHARATYRHTRDLKRQVDLFVYSAGDSARAFELHVSTKSESVCGRKGQIISDWHDEDQTIKAEGFLLDSMNIPDHDFDLKK